MSFDRVSGQAVTPEQLAHVHAPAVLAVCLANARSVHDAEDAMQETMARAISNLDQVRDAEHVRGWVLQIARRICQDQYRRRRCMQSLPEYLPDRDEPTDPRLARLHEALGRLPADYREAISIFYLDGKSSASVAEALGISPAAARQRLSRGRVMLHDLLKEDGP